MRANVGYFLTKSASKVPDKTALVFEGQRRSYAEFNSRANRLAHGLMRLGLKKGEKVATLFFNCPSMCESYFGIIKAGGVLVPLNARLSWRELANMVEHSDSRFLIFDEEFQEIIGLLRPQVTKVEKFIMAGQKRAEGVLPYEELLEGSSAEEPDVEVGEDDDLMIVYTAGTTGQPKGVLVTHRNYIWTALNIATDMGVNPGDINLVVFPIFHTAGLASFFTRVMMGITLILMKKMDLKEMLQSIEKERVVSTAMVPTLLNSILQFPGLTSYDRTSVKKYTSAAAIFPVKLKNQFPKIFPHAALYEIYGLSEAAGADTILLPQDAFRKVACVGKSFTHHEVKVVNEEGKVVAPGEVGEILIRGPVVMKGYFKDPQATSEAIRGGWLYTGDLAKVDEEGYIYIVDRKRDIIVSGGVNIYPREIEEILYTHPKVAEAAVIGVPDEKWGETIKALVVPKEGHTLSEEEVIGFCRENLASYKKPTSVEFLPALPKNAAGKVLKTELRKKYGQLVRY
jgi:acyl-CoA synthetase (AMP-forming)/AMP-acid ligase II